LFHEVFLSSWAPAFRPDPNSRPRRRECILPGPLLRGAAGAHADSRPEATRKHAFQ
jgi:hypothetical protein